MKQLALVWALTGALALATPAFPAAATDESLEARETAAQAVDQARVDLRTTFARATLKPGQHLWRTGHGPGEVTRVVISLEDQLAYAYSEDTLIGVSTISSGREAHPTPTGIFPILEKKRHHRSNKYDDAPMPFMQRLDHYGIALHAGRLPGYPASHGCIRLPEKFAAKLFESTRVGSEVLIGARVRPALAVR